MSIKIRLTRPSYASCHLYIQLNKATYTLKNKGASRCHRGTFLSKINGSIKTFKHLRTFLFHKRLFVVMKEGLQIIKR